jgi:small acid-soluble spore protein P (minor)
MPKKTEPVIAPDEAREQSDRDQGDGNRQEPLSGSKKVKNRNHSRQNHGEGS